MGKHGLGVVGTGYNATPRAKLEQKMGGGDVSVFVVQRWVAFQRRT